MKKTLLIVLLFFCFLASLTSPSSASALDCGTYDCCGAVTDINGNSVSGAKVMLISFGGTSWVVHTDGSGQWFWDAFGVPSSIAFSRNGYRDKTCNLLPAGMDPESCGGSGTIWCEDIQTQLEPEGTEGWTCVDPLTQTCEVVPNGPFDTESGCQSSCYQKYRCEGLGCVGCGIGIDDPDCPYIDHTACVNECFVVPQDCCSLADTTCPLGLVCDTNAPGCGGKDDLFFCAAPTSTPAPGIDIYGSCDKDKGEIDTAIGCIPTKNATVFIKWLLGRAVLIAGGIAFLLMIAGAFMVIVSGGNPDRVKAGGELITSALAGLIFIIFSLFLLRLVGVEFLSIPGL